MHIAQREDGVSVEFNLRFLCGFVLEFLFWFTYSSFGLGAGPVCDCECLFVTKRCATLIGHCEFGSVGCDCSIC